MSLMDEINKQKELNKEAELKAKKEAELRQYLQSFAYSSTKIYLAGF